MELKDQYPFYLGNEPVQGDDRLDVIDKYAGEVATRVCRADAKAIDRAIAAADEAAEPMRQLKAYERKAVLDHCIERFEKRSEELAYSLCVEAGKPIRDSRGEVTRLIDTFRIASEESVRMYGEVMPLDISPRAAAYRGMWKRVPVGPCAFITPFNFPLNLVAHKVAPAIATGCPFVLKPASVTPIGALIIGEILAETDLPKGAFSILPCSSKLADPLVEDDRIRKLSFTGSAAVGWDLKARARKKRVALELGGNAACVVDQDWDLDDAVKRIVFGGYYQSGQSCVSVQRIIVHESVHKEFREKLVAAVNELKVGDPKDENVFIGPMIDEKEAERLESWVNAAKKKGAKVLCGGTRDGAMFQPTLVENVPHNEKIWCDEVFGPLTVLDTFTDFDAVIREVNNSDFGLQAGFFTRDLYHAQKAWDECEVGGVIIGDVPSWRVDHMPYGGIKESGLGREGIRWAMSDMTEVRLMVIRTP